MKVVRPAAPATDIQRCRLRSGLDVAFGYAFVPRVPDALSDGGWLCRGRIQTATRLR